MYEQEVLVEKFWSDSCKQEASTLFLLYMSSYTFAINDILKHMVPAQSDEDTDSAGDSHTPAPTPEPYYSLNTPGMSAMLIPYTLVPLIIVWKLSKRTRYGKNDMRDEERKLEIQRCVRAALALDLLRLDAPSRLPLVLPQHPRCHPRAGRVRREGGATSNPGLEVCVDCERTDSAVTRITLKVEERLVGRDYERSRAHCRQHVYARILWRQAR